MNKTPLIITAIFVFIVIFSMNASAAITYENKTIGYSYQKRAIITTIIKDISCQDNEVYAFISRQHGSEWSGYYIVQGMINELLNHKELVECKEYHFILNANPDGIYKNTANNIKDINLNRVWNSSESAAWETKYTRKYLKTLDDYKQIDFFADVHGYNGAETQSMIFYENDKAEQVCLNSVKGSPEFNCEYTVATNKNAKWYAVNVLKVPVVFTIEPIQKMSRWTKTQYQDIGKRLINTI